MSYDRRTGSVDGAATREKTMITETITSSQPKVRAKPKPQLPTLPPRLQDQVGENMTLNVDILKVDHTYQRPLDQNRIKKIAAHFNLKLVFRIAVNQRPDGSYYIVDGQQRVGAINLIGGNFMVDCVVYRLATVREEAELYEHLNWARKNPNAFDQWRARLAKQDEGVSRIQEELNRANLRLLKGNKSPRTIGAVGAALGWVDRDIEALSVAIRILGRMEFLDQPIGAEVFNGLCTLENHLRTHKQRNSLTRAKNAKETWADHIVKLGFIKLQQICQKGQGDRGTRGGSTIGRRAAANIIYTLNYKMRENALPKIVDKNDEE